MACPCRLAEMAVAWVLRDPRVTSALGTSKVSQLDDNVAALKNLKISAEELRVIDGVLGAATIINACEFKMESQLGTIEAGKSKLGFSKPLVEPVKRGSICWASAL